MSGRPRRWRSRREITRRVSESHTSHFESPRERNQMSAHLVWTRASGPLHLQSSWSPSEGDHRSWHIRQRGGCASSSSEPREQLMVVCAMVSGGEISGRVEVPCRASAVEATTSGDENEAVFGSLDTGGGAAPSPASSMASSDLDRQPEARELPREVDEHAARLRSRLCARGTPEVVKEEALWRSGRVPREGKSVTPTFSIVSSLVLRCVLGVS